ncbi:MAG: hypothetical protein AMXMBFR84_11310 [Candidatus Hydrogenedentota bacterium]
MLRKISCGLMLIPFAASIIVQYNDPDGVIWMLIYLYPFVVTLVGLKRTDIAFAATGALAFLGVAWWWFPVLEKPFLETEQARESGGLAFSGIWMLILTVAWVIERSRAAKPESKTA